MIKLFPTHKEIHCLLKDFEKKVNNSVALFLRQGRYELVEAGYAILNHLQNQMVTVADRVDDLSRERLEESRQLVEEFQRALTRNIEQLQWIINTLPFAGGNPQIGGLTPRYISFTADRNPNLNIVLTISGYFPTIGNLCPVSLSFNNKSFGPSQTLMNQLQFTIPETDFAQPVANAIVQNKGKLIYKRPYMVFFSYQHQFDVVVGTLPITPGNILFHKLQHNPQQEQIRLNWGENSIVPLPNPGWRLIFTPFHGPRREFNTSDLSHPYISVQVLHYQHQLNIQIKDPSTLNLADVQHPVVQAEPQLQQLVGGADWRDKWKMENPEYILFDHEELMISQPMIISYQMLLDNKLVKGQVVDVTNFTDLQGCLISEPYSTRYPRFQAYDLNGNLVDLNPHPPSQTVETKIPPSLVDIKKDVFHDSTFFASGTILSFSRHEQYKLQTHAAKHVSKQLPHFPQEITKTFRLWDLNRQMELWHIIFNDDGNYSETISPFETSIVLSPLNHFMIHLHATSIKGDAHKANGPHYRDRLLVLDSNDGSTLRELDMGTGRAVNIPNTNDCRGNGAFCLDGQTLYLITLQGLLQRWNINTWNMDFEIQTQIVNHLQPALIPIAFNRLLCCSTTPSITHPTSIQVFDDQGTHLMGIQGYSLGNIIHEDIVISNHPVTEAIVIKKKSLNNPYNPQENFYAILDLDNLIVHQIPWIKEEPCKIAIQEELMLVFTTRHLYVIDLNTLDLVRTIQHPLQNNILDIDIENGTVEALLLDKKSDYFKAQELHFQ